MGCGSRRIKLQKRHRRLSSRNFICHDAVLGPGSGRLRAYLFMFLNLFLAFGQYLPLSWFETSGSRRFSRLEAVYKAGSRRGESRECNPESSFCQGIPPCEKLISGLKFQPGSRASGSAVSVRRMSCLLQSRGHDELIL